MPKGFLVRRQHDLSPPLTPKSLNFDPRGQGQGHGQARPEEDEDCSGFDPCPDVVRLGCSSLSSRDRLWLKGVTRGSSATSTPSKPFSDPIIGKMVLTSPSCHSLRTPSSTLPSSSSSSASSSLFSENFPCQSSSAYSSSAYSPFAYSSAYTSSAYSSASSAPSISAICSFSSFPNCSYSTPPLTTTSSTSPSSSSTAPHNTSSSSPSRCVSSISSFFPSSYGYDQSVAVGIHDCSKSVTAVDANGSTQSDRNRFKIRRLLEPVPASCLTDLERTKKDIQLRSTWISLDNDGPSRPKPHDPVSTAADPHHSQVQDSLRFLPYSPWNVPVRSTVKSDRWKTGASVGSVGPPGNRPRSVDSIGTLETIENRIGDFICQLCKSRFPDAFRLADHNCSCIRRIEYRCIDCNKLFNCPANLASHRRWHKPDPRHNTQQGSKPQLRRDPAAGVRRPGGVAVGGPEFAGQTLAQRWPNEVC